MNQRFRLLSAALAVGCLVWLLSAQLASAHNGEVHSDDLLPHRVELLPLAGLVLAAGLGYWLIRRRATGD